MPMSTPGGDPTTAEAVDEPWDADEVGPATATSEEAAAMGQLRARTRMPFDHETRWSKPHEAVAPRCTLRRNRSEGRPSGCPSEEDRPRPECPATAASSGPDHTSDGDEVDDLRGDHQMPPRRSGYPRVTRARVLGAGARIIGRSAPRSPKRGAKPHSRWVTTAANRDRRTDARQPTARTTRRWAEQPTDTPHKGGVRQDDLPIRRAGSRLLPG